MVGPKLPRGGYGPRGFSSSGFYHPKTKFAGDSRSGVLPEEKYLTSASWEAGLPPARGACLAHVLRGQSKPRACFVLLKRVVCPHACTCVCARVPVHG